VKLLLAWRGCRLFLIEVERINSEFVKKNERERDEKGVKRLARLK